ncbi:alanine--glyoxylate aminotransferase 2, mitochondrial isoform X2 [Mirounga leonina]|uniref:Alanine--glyoxylate aminotransferase 2, mitochondrial n=1 Tax=Neomonachus schauinslandi TaxID=29088 RepID=A0A2Y9HJJ1_NEOSC|nr:alanine--glyoxylate aminotransferase 2, mitochondrial isoform X2 [Neomonachus schauinslandi]XP_034854872.1 alanine--glyoxylate aminotransferase 2, mitochondrial isoform X2 [Mirounga leonina]XP_034855057.1 alanine--glyoxylate aminotransferase 2, mitochondrial isoform X2 [Mirounga leonina]
MTPAWRHLLRAWHLQTSSPRITKMCPSLSPGAFWTSVANLGLHTKPRMPPCDFTPEKYQSLTYERVLEIHNHHLIPTRIAYFRKPLLLHQGHMEWLFDYEGNRYLDFFSGIVTVSVGHCHPKVNAAAQKQLGRLWHTSALFFHSPIHEFAEKLSALLPEPLKVIFLVNSGSEANDLAMLMARAHSNSTDIISLRGAYHGCSPYTLGLTNVGPYKMELPSGLGCQSTMCPDVFRGPWGGSHCRDSPVQTMRKCSCAPDCCQAKDQYIEQFKDTLNTSVAKSIAGFFAEPIQGVNGVVQYPKGFLREAFELVRERGGVCIADEVIKEEKLQENSQEVGTYMLQKFAELRDEFEIVGDVRGKGLMIGIEMVKDKVSSQPLPQEEVNEIHEDCKRMGLLIGKGGIFAQTFRITPSMCITKPDVHFAVEVFRSALIQHMERRAK